MRDVAVAAVTFSAFVRGTDYPYVAPFEDGCTTVAYVPPSYSGVQTKVAEYQQIIDDARIEIQTRVDCETNALARLQQLTSVQNADPQDYLLTQAQKDVMKEAHEKQERMQDLITFEIARAADTYERHRLSLPSYQVAIDSATASLALYQSSEDYIAAGDNASYDTLLSRTQIQRTALANSIASLEAAVAPAETAVTTAENNYRDFLVNLLDIEYEVHRYEEKLADGEDVQANIDSY